MGLYVHVCPPNYQLLTTLAAYGHINILEWIYNYEQEKKGAPMNLNYGTKKNDSPLMNAASNGELETIKWLYEVRVIC